jgi:hypothetical protein
LMPYSTTSTELSPTSPTSTPNLLYPVIRYCTFTHDPGTKWNVGTDYSVITNRNLIYHALP